jgi:prepilin-type N-terminal cleavage/methylation domain-containing protein
MSPRAAKPGFTLLEVVLAVTLALVLMAAMFTFYKQSSDVRASLSEEAQTVGAERAVMGLITNELRSALVNRLAGLGLEGGIDRMRFATTTLPPRSGWSRTPCRARPPRRNKTCTSWGTACASSRTSRASCTWPDWIARARNC